MVTSSVYVAAYLLLKNHRPRVLRTGSSSFNFEFDDLALADVTDYQNGAVVPARLLADAHSTIKRLMRMASAVPTEPGR